MFAHVRTCQAVRRVLTDCGRKSPFSSGPGHYHRESSVTYGLAFGAGCSAVSNGAGGFWYGTGDEGHGLS
jgi:hypothetical protein